MSLPVDPDLRAAALALCEGFAELLDALVSGHVYRCGQRPAPPTGAGVYVFSDGGQVVHVGRTRNLQARRRNQTGLNNTRDVATHAFRRASATARDAHDDLPRTRKGLEHDPRFKPFFDAEKQYLRTLDFRCVELEDPAEQAMFEIVASVALGLPRELWRTS